VSVELSVVIPLYNEEPNVAPLHAELSAILSSMAVPYEIVAIDDGCTDGTFEVLRRIQKNDPHVRVVRFTRNFGQTAAFAAGFAFAPGMHRYLPALASQLGDRVTEVVVNHRPRRFGQSKYGLSRTFRVIGDLFTLRRLMREAVDPATPVPKLYELAEVLE